jgi:murein DD-endopeptidase MepM/ murein hydrolase activator NlpD
MLTLLTVAVAVLPSTASASPHSDQVRVSQLEQKIAADGEQVQELVTSYNQAVVQEEQATAKVQAAQAHLASDQAAANQALVGLRSLALQLYMNDSDTQASLQIFAGGSLTSSAAEQEYSSIANAGLRNALDAVNVDIKQTQADEVVLRAAQTQAAATVAQLGAAKDAAQAALAQDDALLSQVKSSLAIELAQAAQREEQEEEAMAAAAAVNPTAYNFNPTPGTYDNPLRGIAALNPERVDQGVDYSGYGPIYAVGDAQILSTSNSGWPGGTFICYKMTDGPAAGLAMYSAEDIEPTVSVGQTVNAGTVIGNMYEGPDGIETGWADPSCDGVTMARDYGQFSGSNSTAYGANYSQMLAWLGAPPGVMQNDPPTGSLPPNWPQWP